MQHLNDVSLSLWGFYFFFNLAFWLKGQRLCRFRVKGSARVSAHHDSFNNQQAGFQIWIWVDSWFNRFIKQTLWVTIRGEQRNRCWTTNCLTLVILNQTQSQCPISKSSNMLMTPSGGETKTVTLRWKRFDFGRGWACRGVGWGHVLLMHFFFCLTI